MLYEKESDSLSHILITITGVVGSLVVRASDSRREGLVRCPMPPNTLRVHTELMFFKSVGPEVSWAESRGQGTRELFPSLQFHA
ncbi:uncharacterized protein TNCV_217401 [Trichonephila clavipes]|nr:uncharacterized protein TNCV_217401 [Trichonephila clavipes]